MAYNEQLAHRIREHLTKVPNVEEKAMMGGLTFMVNDKMTVGIIKDEMMCRIDPDLHEMSVKKTGCHTMDFMKRPMKGFVMISDEGMRSEKDFDYWINLCLEFNKRSKSSKKKRS
jgi:TfoX/Sxy family transcriptional regulator of competence genes